MSERLRQLRGSLVGQRRAVLSTGLVLGLLAAVAATAVRTGTPAGSARPLDRSAAPAGHSSGAPFSPIPTGGTGGFHLPLAGTIHLTAHRAGAVTTYQGTCNASGECALAPATGSATGTLAVTIDPRTGAVLAIDSPSIPSSRSFSVSGTIP